MAGTVNFELQNAFNADIGAQDSHELSINAIQTVTVQFTGPTTNVPGDTPSAVNIPVSIITSDGNPLVSPVSVDVRDLLTGSAGNPADYTMTTPQTLTWLAGRNDGDTELAGLNTTGINGPTETIDLDLDNVSGATEGAQNTHEVTLVNIGA